MRNQTAVVLTVLLLAGCQGTNPQPTTQIAAPSPSAAPALNRGMPSKDEQACLLAVTNKTQNGDVVLLAGTETSEANNTVYVGVGPQRAKWRCLVKNGRVAEVMSLTNEGSL